MPDRPLPVFEEEQVRAVARFVFAGCRRGVVLVHVREKRELSLAEPGARRGVMRLEDLPAAKQSIVDDAHTGAIGRTAARLKGDQGAAARSRSIHKPGGHDLRS